LKKLTKTHLHESFDAPKWTTWINRIIFNNTLHAEEINSSVLLEDDSNENDGHDEFSVLKTHPV